MANMAQGFNRRVMQIRWIKIVLLLAVAGGAYWIGAHRCPERSMTANSGAPSAAAIRPMVENAAIRFLPEPRLAQHHFRLESNPEGIAVAESILRHFTEQNNGTILPSSLGKTRSLLISVPTAALESGQQEASAPWEGKPMLPPTRTAGEIIIEAVLSTESPEPKSPAVP